MDTVGSLPAAAAPPDGAPAGAPPVRDATQLLRQLLEVSDLFEERLRGHLTVNQTDLDAMGHLLASGPLGPSDLARRLHISTASATTLVDRLVGLGHVTREPHPTDRRGVLVVPTASSRERAMAMLAPMIADVDAVLDDFTPGEQQTITEYLSRVVGVYRSHVTGAAPDPAGARR
ncbi:MarR family transcriptional regulator [Microbacterium sp. BK668]|uniref:MarR family winged helix-turn-helix transcriptional regulator n=1 Tax=Microbacterium sp. BK668 TaxID=2512118 RepID=UPI0010DDBAF2|nr:MarR family transcriptional regulator [Microbacterium sp. BK668]TDN91636.1 DNA-binding MarR family transcriptional regulator [Microbacterium sp. BK668]